MVIAIRGTAAIWRRCPGDLLVTLAEKESYP